MFDGDGSLLMHVQELETIRRHGLNILIVVMNDGAYGSEIHKLRAAGLSEEGAVFGRTDFAAVARTFGVGHSGFRPSGLHRHTTRPSPNGTPGQSRMKAHILDDRFDTLRAAQLRVA
jgi:hypothetical protein